MQILCSEAETKAVVGEVADVPARVSDVCEIALEIVVVRRCRRTRPIYVLDHIHQVAERIEPRVFGSAIRIGDCDVPWIANVARGPDCGTNLQRTLKRVICVGGEESCGRGRRGP